MSRQPSRVAIVTGGSRGIGYAVAENLARHGVDLILNSRSPQEAAEVLAQIGPSVVPVAGDLSDAQLPAQLVRAAEKLGRLDIVFLNYGGPPVRPVLEVDDAEWATYFELIVTGPMRLLREAVPHLRQSGAGRVVAITSFCVKSPYPGLGVSSGLRAALVNALKTLAIELGPDGILVNSVAPGYIATERLIEWNRAYAIRENTTEIHVAERTTRTVPLGRFGTPQEVAAFIGFLLSEQNGYVTGQHLLVDGGLVTAD